MYVIKYNLRCVSWSSSGKNDCLCFFGVCLDSPFGETVCMQDAKIYYRNRPIRFQLSECWPIMQQQYACTMYIRCSLDGRAHSSLQAPLQRPLLWMSPTAGDETSRGRNPENGRCRDFGRRRRH